MYLLSLQGRDEDITKQRFKPVQQSIIMAIQLHEIHLLA